MSSDHSLTLLYLSLPNKKIELQISLCNSSSHLHMKLLEIWIPQKSRFFPTVFHTTKWESKNEITGITQPSRLFYMIQHRQFQVGCLFGLTPEQTDKQNKQVGYYCNTGGYELFGYQSCD